MVLGFTISGGKIVEIDVIADPKKAPCPFRARRPNLYYYVRFVWPLAAFVEVLIYPGVHSVRSRTGPVAVRLGIGCTLVFAAVLHLVLGVKK